MDAYNNIIKPLLFQLDPEQSHDFAKGLTVNATPILAALSSNFIYPKDDLQITLFGNTLSNPIGLAAGFDKNADLVQILKYLGFGYAEVGGVTAQPHSGNPKPRLWRLPADKALINWMGFNSEGAVRVAEKLAKSQFSLPTGVNVAKTNKPGIHGEAAQEDVLFTLRTLRYLPFLYITIDISCVNTPEGILKDTTMLSALLEQVNKENTRKIPILLKLSEDADDDLTEKIVATGKEYSVAGYVCGNTTRQRPPLTTSPEIIAGIRNGGLSGPPIKKLVLPLCRKVYALKERNQIIISTGGISKGQDAYDYIRAGSTALQIYTALVYEGPGIVRKICEELSALLKRDGLTLSKAIGMDCSSPVGSKN